VTGEASSASPSAPIEDFLIELHKCVSGVNAGKVADYIPELNGYALQHYGRDYVLRHVGVEPTGEAFNSIVLDEVANRPFNPMINTGAIAVAALMPGNTAEERIATMLDLFSNLAGRRLEIDQSVLQSEQATGHRNRNRLYDAEHRHDRTRSHRGARPLFSTMFHHHQLPRPRHDGGDARQ
jgi:glutaminase